MTTASAAMAINPGRAKPFANFSNVMLADEMGDIDTKLSELKKRQDDARKEMTRRVQFSIEGSRFTVVKQTKTQLRFDGDAVKAEMGEDWYEERRKPVDTTTYTVIPMQRPPEPAPAASPERAAAEALFKARG